MKLFKYTAIAAGAAVAEWDQPTYRDAIEMWKTRSDDQWGHPVGVKAAAEWSLCPELALPTGVAGTACQGATCMVVCDEGKVAIGKRRVKCRWTRKKGFFWKTTLPECRGCTPDPPQPNDTNVTTECIINNIGKKKCTLQCSNGGKLFGRNKIKMTCKCPRVNGVKTCGWKALGSMIEPDSDVIQTIACEGGTAPATSPPQTEAPMTTAETGSTDASGSTVAAESTVASSSTAAGGSTEASGSTVAGESTMASDSTVAVTTPAATTAADTTAAVTTPAATTAAATTAAATTAAPTTAASSCLDPNTSTGVKENSDGSGGCPAKMTQWSLGNFEALNGLIGFDPNQSHGVHLDGKSYIGAGGGLEAESSNFGNAQVTRFNLCSDLASYGATPTATVLGQVGNNCATDFAWVWQSTNSNKHDTFAYVAASPDKSYVIAAGVREGATTTDFERWLVKLDASTGTLIWEIILPGDAMSGPRAGFESIAFTSDGGFIAGGFTNYEGDFPSFKSGGQIDSGNPIFQKFSAATAAGTEAFVTMPTPEWTYKCGDNTLGAVSCPGTVQAAVNTMRVFTDAGVEKVAATFRPSVVVVVDVATGAELAFQDVPAITDFNDKYQDIEVEVGADGAVTGYVIGGLTASKDTTTAGCSATAAGFCSSWLGVSLKLSPDLSTTMWRTTFGDFTGGVGDYAPGGVPVTPAGTSVVYTECFGMAAIPTGYVLACGQGIEGCPNPSDWDASVDAACATDPRRDWRGLAIAINGETGAIDWYNLANWGPGEPNEPTSSSAYEWVSFDPSDPTTLVFFTDEAYGFGFSTYDTTQLITPTA